MCVLFTETGRQKLFGFCDFTTLEGVRRAIRLLNGLKVDESVLVVKVDSKSQALLDDPENADPADATDDAALALIQDAVKARNDVMMGFAKTGTLRCACSSTGYLSIGPIEIVYYVFVASPCARRTGAGSQAFERMHNTLRHRSNT